MCWRAARVGGKSGREREARAGAMGRRRRRTMAMIVVGERGPRRRVAVGVGWRSRGVRVGSDGRLRGQAVGGETAVVLASAAFLVNTSRVERVLAEVPTTPGLGLRGCAYGARRLFRANWACAGVRAGGKIGEGSA